jgi:hypothetical protein
MSTKCLRIKEKVTSDLWNNITPDLWNRGWFENSIDFDLCQCNRNTPTSQICLSLVGYRAPIFIIHFKNQITAQMLSYAWHSAASQSHPLLGSLKAKSPGVSKKSALPPFPMWGLINHQPRECTSYHRQVAICIIFKLLLTSESS